MTVISFSVGLGCAAVWLGNLLLWHTTMRWQRFYPDSAATAIIRQRIEARLHRTNQILIGILLVMLLLKPLFAGLYTLPEVAAIMSSSMTLLLVIFLPRLVREPASNTKYIGKLGWFAMHSWFFISAVSLIGLATYELISSVNITYAAPVSQVTRIAIVSSGSVLGGTAITTLVILLLPPAHNDAAMLSLVRQWIRILCACSSLFLMVGYTIGLHRWGDASVIALVEISIVLLPNLANWVMFTLIRRSEREIAQCLPIRGFSDRTHSHIRSLAQRQVQQTIATLRVAAVITLATISGAIWLAIPPQTYWWGLSSASQIVPRLLPTATTGTALTPFSGTLTQNNAAITVTLQTDTLLHGHNQVTFTLHDSQGQAIPGASIAVVTTPSNMTHTGSIVTALPASTSPDLYRCDLDLDSTGTWQVVVMVATADQSLSSSVVFTVMVG